MISSIDTLSNLTDYLQNEIKVNVFTKRLKEIKFFRELFKDETLEQLALKMSEKIYSPEQSIIDINNVQEPMLSIVHSGAVKKFAIKSENNLIKEIKTIYEGEIFGFDIFVKESYQADFNYKSHGISSVIQVSLSQFLEILKKNEEDYEKYIFIKDQLIYNQNYGVTYSNCDSCWQKFHTLENCPFIFYLGKKEVILRQYFKNIDETIKNFKRPKPSFSFNAIFNQKDIQNSIEIFNKNQLENSFDDEDDDDEDDSDSQQDDKQTLINKDIPDRDDSSNVKINDKHSQKEGSNKHFLGENDSSSINQTAQKSEKNQTRLQLLQKKSIPNRITLNEESYCINDGILQIQPKRGSHNEQSLKQMSFSDFQGKNASELENADSFKNLKSQKKELNLPSYVNMRRYSPNTDQSSLSKKLEQINEQQQQQYQKMKTLLKQESKERMNTRSLNLNSQMSSQIDRLNQDKSTKFSFDRTLIVDRANLSEFIQAIPQLENQFELFDYQFDGLKIFQFYFPNYNYESIIAKISQKFITQLRLIKQNQPKKSSKFVKKQV